MERVVDDCLGRCTLVVFLDNRAQRLAAVLGGEGDHGRVPAKRRRHGPAVEIIRRSDPHPRQLIDMAVTVDSARKDQLAAGIDLACGTAQSLAKRNDTAGANADVA